MTAEPWTDEQLADLLREYDHDAGDPDVVDLVRGVRAVLRLHRDSGEYDHPTCLTCRCKTCGARHVAHPCRTLAALNHPEETP